jgi:hypothetical protein
MPPPIVTATLEVEFVPGSGTWVDISDRVNDLTIDRPAARPGEDQAPTTLTVALKNYPSTLAGAGLGYCPFVPNSPTSRYYPNVARDRRVRVTATSGATSWVRFLGFVDKWLPQTGSGPAEATCTLTASDVLSRYARKQLLSFYGETVLKDTLCDYWPLNDPPDAQTVRGRSGLPGTWPARDGLVIAPSGPPGTMTLSSPADIGHLTDGQITLARGDKIYSPSPVILLEVRPGQLFGGFAASFRLTEDPLSATGDDMVTGYNYAGTMLWQWSVLLTGGKIQWELRDFVGSARSFLTTDGPRDDAWHWWQIKFPSAVSSQIFLRDKGTAVRGFGSAVWSFLDPRNTKWVVVGGTMNPMRKGKQENTFQGQISSFTMHHTSTVFDYSEFSVPGVASDAGRVTTFLSLEGTDVDTLVGGATAETPDSTPIMYTNETSNLLDRWNEHTRSTGGRLSVRPDGRRRYTAAELSRPAAVALTLDASDDLDMPSGDYQEAQEERPTRVSVSGPVGSVTLVDDAAEALLGMSLEDSPIETSAGSLDVARSVAALAMGGVRARLAQFAVDLTLAGTDKTATAMALRVGDRIRLQGLPPEFAGLTSVDVYASGWSERYTGHRQAVFVFDTDPADDPPEGILDDAEYGDVAFGDGVATVTGGTCVGTTGTGTVIVTSSSPASTSAGDYPTDLDWLGERITVTAPGGGTSPQTFTVTARGVAPSVARVHASGEAVDGWHAATFGF